MEAPAISRMGCWRIIGSHLRDMTKNELGFAPWVFETFAPLRARNPADTTLQYRSGCGSTTKLEASFRFVSASISRHLRDNHLRQKLLCGVENASAVLGGITIGLYALLAILQFLAGNNPSIQIGESSSQRLVISKYPLTAQIASGLDESQLGPSKPEFEEVEEIVLDLEDDEADKKEGAEDE